MLGKYIIQIFSNSGHKFFESTLTKKIVLLVLFNIILSYLMKILNYRILTKSWLIVSKIFDLKIRTFDRFWRILRIIIFF